MVIKTCKRCNKEYTTKHKISIFCSRDCWNKYIARNIKDNKTSLCVLCKKTFTYPWSKATPKYCSKECRVNARIKKKKIVKKPQGLIEKQKIKCCRCNRAYATGFYKTKPFCSKCWGDRKK